MRGDLDMRPARSACGAAILGCFLAGCGARSTLSEGGSDREPPSVPAAVPRFDCQVSTSSRPMLAARLDSKVHFVYPDRSSEAVLDLDVPEGMYVTHADVIARGDRVAVYAVVKALGAGEPPPFAEVAVLKVDGSVLFRERFDFAYEGWGSDSHLVGNADELFVLTLIEVQAGLGLVLDGGEAQPFTERMAARSDPDAEGRLVVWDAETSSTSQLHFFDTAAGTFTPSRYITRMAGDPEGLASSPAVLDAGLLYLQRDPPRLVREDASGTAELPIDTLPSTLGHVSSGGYATPGYAHSGGYALFMLAGTTPEDTRYLATHFASGEVREFRLIPPAGYLLPQDYWNPPPIDARGRLLVRLFTGDTIHLHATKDGALWEPLGLPIAAGSGPTRLVEAAGTVLFHGSGSNGEVPGALPAWTDQLIGPEGGQGVELVRWDPDAPSNPLDAEDEMSADGGCVAYFRSGSLHVIEVADYSTSDLGLTTAAQSAEMAWIPLPD